MNDKNEPDKDKCWHFILIFMTLSWLFVQHYQCLYLLVPQIISTQMLGSSINFDADQCVSMQMKNRKWHATVIGKKSGIFGCTDWFLGNKCPVILYRNCVALPHSTLLHRNCDVTALWCRMKVKFILTWNAVKLRWLAAEIKVIDLSTPQRKPIKGP